MALSYFYSKNQQARKRSLQEIHLLQRLPVGRGGVLNLPCLTCIRKHLNGRGRLYKKVIKVNYD